MRALDEVLRVPVLLLRLIRAFRLLYPNLILQLSQRTSRKKRLERDKTPKQEASNGSIILTWRGADVTALLVPHAPNQAGKQLWLSVR